MLETLAGPYTLKQILQDHWPFFLAKYGDHVRPSIIEEVEKVMRCRDPLKAGYHLYRCPAHPGVERIVPYRHIVWTIPDKLWNVFLWDRKLLDILFTAARVVILEWCAGRGFVPGIVMVVHTFGSKVNVNTHIHMLVTEGGLNLEKNGWVHNDYFPWAAFKDPWKYYVKTPLRRRMKEMIGEGKIGSPYRELGTGQPFRRLVEQVVAIEVVCACGVEPCLCPVYHLLHRAVRQTAGHGPKQDQSVRRGIRHVRV